MVSDCVPRQVSVQRLEPALTVVVLHSTHAFATESEAVYGATSAAARLAGAKTDALVEARLVASLVGAAEARLTTPLIASLIRPASRTPLICLPHQARLEKTIDCLPHQARLEKTIDCLPHQARLTNTFGMAANFRSPMWGPHLHRWGAAFPTAPLLPRMHAFVPSARVGFCGDFVDTGDGRGGSVEGAALSGMQMADALVEALRLDGSAASGADRCDGGKCVVL